MGLLKRGKRITSDSKNKMDSQRTVTFLAPLVPFVMMMIIIIIVVIIVYTGAKNVIVVPSGVLDPRPFVSEGLLM